MFCPNCGKEVQTTTKFCIYCGAAMPAEGSSPPDQPETQPAPEQTVQPDVSQNPTSEASGGASAIPETPQSPTDHRMGLSSVIRSNTAYYLSEFQKLDQGMKPAFNWPAFLLGPFFCLYRKCLDILAKYFAIPILLIVAAFVLHIIGVEKVSLTAIIAAQILSGIGSLFALICCIRSGRHFNREYYWHCNKVLKSGEKGDFGTSFSYIFASLAFLAVIGATTQYFLNGDDDMYLPGHGPSQYSESDISEDDSLLDPTPEEPETPEIPEADVSEFQYPDSGGVFDLGNGQEVEYYYSDFSIISQEIFTMTSYQAEAVEKALAGRYMGVAGCINNIYNTGEISVQLYDGDGNLLLDFVYLTLVPEQEELLLALNQYDDIIALARIEDQDNFSDVILLSVNDNLLTIPYISGNIPGLTTYDDSQAAAASPDHTAPSVSETSPAANESPLGQYYGEYTSESGSTTVLLSEGSDPDTFYVYVSGCYTNDFGNIYWYDVHTDGITLNEEGVTFYATGAQGVENIIRHPDNISGAITIHEAGDGSLYLYLVTEYDELLVQNELLIPGYGY